MLPNLVVPTAKPREILDRFFNSKLPLEIPPKNKKEHAPFYSEVVCKFFIKNSCTKGDSCMFSHDLNKLKNTIEEAVERPMFISPF
jgi:hypothetical protein